MIKITRPFPPWDSGVRNDPKQLGVIVWATGAGLS